MNNPCKECVVRAMCKDTCWQLHDHVQYFFESLWPEGHISQPAILAISAYLQDNRLTHSVLSFKIDHGGIDYIVFLNDGAIERVIKPGNPNGRKLIWEINNEPM